MGYMGFGLQRWIYRMKPRKPFSRIRKGDGVFEERGHELDIERFYKVEHKITHNIHEQKLTPELKVYLYKNFKLERIISRYKTIFILLIISLIMLFIFYNVNKVNRNIQLKNNPYLKREFINEELNTKTIFSYFKDYNNLYSIRHFKNGKKDGLNTYYRNGQIESIEKYENNILTYKIDFYNNQGYYIKYEMNEQGIIEYGKGYNFNDKLIFEGPMGLISGQEGKISPWFKKKIEYE